MEQTLTTVQVAGPLENVSIPRRGPILMNAKMLWSVTVSAGLQGYSRLTEIEAWGN